MLDLDSFLLSLYVLVEAQALFGAAENWSSSPAYRPRGHHPRNTRPVASLEKRARFLALCSRTSAPLLPQPLLPKPTQPEGALYGARVAQLPSVQWPKRSVVFRRSTMSWTLRSSRPL